MKKLNLSELENVNGGGIGVDVLVRVGIAVFSAVIFDWENFKAGLSGDAPVEN